MVVDDGTSVESTTFRESYLEALGSAIRAAQPCSPRLYPPDPAAWCDVHWRGVIVHPSQVAARFTGPDQLPDLVIDGTLEPGNDKFKQFATAIETAVRGNIDSTGAPLLALNSAYDATALFKGCRKAQSDSERRLLQALGPLDEASLLIAVQRDDESALGVPSYVPEWTANLDSPPYVNVNSVVVPSHANGTCAVDATSFPRLREYAELSEAWWGLEPWPASPECFRVDVSREHGDFVLPCWEKAPTRASDGSVNCRTFAIATGNEPCSSQLGWVDPLVPVEPFAHDPPGTRYCEVTQLKGAARDSCETDLNCSDCTPGFCYTRVPELTEFCLNQGMYPQLRVVHGANAGGTVRLRSRCELDDSREQ